MDPSLGMEGWKTLTDQVGHKLSHLWLKVEKHTWGRNRSMEGMICKLKYIWPYSDLNNTFSVHAQVWWFFYKRYLKLCSSRNTFSGSSFTLCHSFSSLDTLTFFLFPWFLACGLFSVYPILPSSFGLLTCLCYLPGIAFGVPLWPCPSVVQFGVMHFSLWKNILCSPLLALIEFNLWATLCLGRESEKIIQTPMLIVFISP